MNLETPLKNIESFLDSIIGHSDNVFLANIRLNPGNAVEVFLDAEDGITIEKCTQVNKALYKYIEETEMFPGGNFSLEVSSPGLDEPLKLYRQYKKNVGRNVEITMNDGSSKQGKLVEVSDENIVIEQKQGKGNKGAIEKRIVTFNQIKHTKVLVTF
ncbi:MAG: ribosome maturation factor [Ginsengibacter sp.]